MSGKEMHICVLPHAAGYHQASWRRPRTVGNDIWNWDLWRGIAQRAEAARLDAVFLADNVSLWPVPEEVRHRTAKVGGWDAFVMATAMATATSQIGIVATGHTEFYAPYTIARKVACIDHLSRGRAGWNVVTSAGPQDAKNYHDRGQPANHERYARATEFVDVVKGLWDSWDDDAYEIDQAAGRFYDPAKLHELNHHGHFYDVAGPLNVMRPPQGYPVLAQAGLSGPGRRFAGTIGELIFTPLNGSAGRAAAEEIRGFAAEAGRRRDDLRILSQVLPITGRTDAEAEGKWEFLQNAMEMEIARGQVGSMLSLDLSTLPLDQPLPELGTTDRVQGGRDAAKAYIAKRAEVLGRPPTVRELIVSYRGSGVVVGSAKTVADYLESEVDSGACDGFVVLTHGLPEDFDDFVSLAIPELQRRGRFRTEYRGSTLRDHLGLRRPVSQYASVRV
jgi:FMN-dependent oxidoreductase (nitrilotriacetate monooxygenase family)